jgi:hypothetical protein
MIDYYKNLTLDQPHEVQTPGSSFRGKLQVSLFYFLNRICYLIYKVDSPCFNKLGEFVYKKARLIYPDRSVSISCKSLKRIRKNKKWANILHLFN